MPVWTNSWPIASRKRGWKGQRWTHLTRTHTLYIFLLDIEVLLPIPCNPKIVTLNNVREIRFADIQSPANRKTSILLATDDAAVVCPPSI